MEQLKRKLNTLVIQGATNGDGLLELIKGDERLELVKHCHSAQQAAEIFGFVHTDLVFVNVDGCTEQQLSDLMIANPKGLFILMTNEPGLNIPFLDPQIFDCLILPLTTGRFRLAIRRIREHYLLQNQSELREKAPAGPTILVKSGAHQHQLAIADIVYIESDGEYLKYHTQNGKYMALGSLRRLVRSLSADFVQVHRSYVVNRNYVLAKKRQTLELIGNRMIPIGKTYRNAFQFISNAVIL